MQNLVKGAALLTAMIFAALPVVAQAPELAMLDRLERGGWNLHIRTDDRTQRICVRTGREFIQLRHNQPSCSRFVVQDEPDEITVQYTCRGNGYGRTTIRREGRGIVQIRTQGTYAGAPFSLEGEARHTGRC